MEAWQWHRHRQPRGKRGWKGGMEIDGGTSTGKGEGGMGDQRGEGRGVREDKEPSRKLEKIICKGVFLRESIRNSILPS